MTHKTSHVFEIWTPAPFRRHRADVVAANRSEAVDIVAREWFSGVAEHAERAVSAVPWSTAGAYPWLEHGRIYTAEASSAAYAAWPGREAYEAARDREFDR